MVDGKPQYQDNFVTLANRAGFQTWWFSNQGQIGEYDTAIASIAKRADEVQFLKNGDFEANKNTQDEQLLKLTEQVLSVQRTQPQLIVLHLMGSHPQACDSHQGKIYRLCAIERDVLLSLQHDANRYAARQALSSAAEFRRKLLDDLFFRSRSGL
ncbi:Putative phosphoethanolamine transferase ybiP [Raoultella ornithinolytica]|nr:Putative phosphoethanolamine transferase ybiP [Raoultella ornithinolytica]